MTCIVGIPHNGRVWMGGDAAAVSSHDGDLEVRVEPKVWVRRGMIFGGTTSFRDLQIIEHRLDIPRMALDSEDLVRWLVVEFADALRKAKSDAGATGKTSDGQETGPNFMVGIRGRLFTFDTDYQAYECRDGHAVGSGSKYARGSLHTSAQMWTRPSLRINAALEAACHGNAFCRPPFTILSA